MIYHYITDPQDRKAWGRVACGRKGRRTPFRADVTCPHCIKQVEWNLKRYEAACEKRLRV